MSRTAAGQSRASSRWRASFCVDATGPWYRSGHSATAAEAVARRRVRALMWALSPHHSCTTISARVVGAAGVATNSARLPCVISAVVVIEMKILPKWPSRSQVKGSVDLII